MLSMNGLSAEPGWRGDCRPGAAVVEIEVVARSLPREPLAGRVVEHDDSHVVRRVPVEHRALAADDALDVGLQCGVQRGLDAGRPVVAEIRQHVFHEMRRGKRRRFSHKPQTLIERLGRASPSSRPSAIMRCSTRLWRAVAALKLRYGLKPDGRGGRPARNAACAGVSAPAEHPK
jgi:hypothetical protein